MYHSNQYQQPYGSTQTAQQISSLISTQLNVKNPLVSQLKSLLDNKISNAPRRKINLSQGQTLNSNNQSPYPIVKQKIFTSPAKAYFILNSLYQSFKKKNQFKLLQEKVHRIQVFHSDEEAKIYDQRGPLSNQKQNNHKIRVTPHIMFSSHETQLSGVQIIKFIQMEEYIKPGVKNQLLNQILRAIANLKDIKQIMKCYQKLFSTNYCSRNPQLKELVEQKMIKKILSIDFNQHQTGSKNEGFYQIGKSLLGFPSISQNILYFIGLLFDKIETNPEEYDFLYKIMRNNFQFQLDNLQEAIQDTKNKKQIQALMKVNNKQNNDLIKSLLRVYAKVSQKSPDLGQDKLINVLRIAQTEAKYKLMKITSVQESTSEPTVSLQVKQQQVILGQQEQQVAEKTQYTLKFISQVIKSGSNIWLQINQWLKSTKSAKTKAFLLNQITSYLQRCFNDERKFKSYVIPHVRIIYRDIEQTSEIYRLWLRNFLRPIPEKSATKQKFLKYTVIKKFIIKGMVNSQNLPLYVQDIFCTSLLHSELLYDVFTLQRQKAFTFYKQVIQSQTYSKSLLGFLHLLKERNPVKLKDWLVKVDQIKGGDLFACSRYALIQFMQNNMKIQLAFSWVRDLALFPPSKFLVWNLIRIIAIFKLKKEFPAIRNCIVRALNLILIRTPVSKLCDQFKKHLPTLAQQFKDFKQDYEIIFADVSQETLNQLKRAHLQSQVIKF